MMYPIALVYLLGFFAVAAVTYLAACNEPTAHGQGIILPMGFLLALLWPVALVWVLIVVLVYAVRGGCCR